MATVSRSPCGLVSSTTKLHLHSAPLSGSSARVRIACRLKGIPNVIYHNIDLSTSQQTSAAYLGINPNATVPALILENPGTESVTITQSSAILDLLENHWPEPSLVPRESGQELERARVLELVNLVQCDIQPVQSSRVRRKIREDFEGDGDHWARWFYERGFGAYEEFLRRHGGGRDGGFSVGMQVSLADVYLIPAVQVAWRVGVKISSGRWPLLKKVVERCWGIEEFRKGGLDGEGWEWDIAGST